MADVAGDTLLSAERVLLRIPCGGRYWVITSRTAYVLMAAAVVYILSQWNALTNQYCIMDDVRQQVYWMQRWIDPELFQDDILSRYAKDYVPWGVQAVYYLGSFLASPVQFTKVVAFILYLAAMGFLYGLAKGFGDGFTAVTVVCVCFFFPGFMTKISGGLSQGFVYPLLSAYLYFLSTKKTVVASFIILIQSFFNPYVFTLCLATHGLYVLHQQLMPLLRNRRFVSGLWPKFARIVVTNLPVMVGIALILIKYLLIQSAEFGEIVTWKDMEGKPEYSEFGRTEDLPPRSIFWELILPWTYFFPFSQDLPILFWLCLSAVAVSIAIVFLRQGKNMNLAGFRVFAYLLPASVILYAISYHFLLRLFIPNRYIEFSFTIFYAVLLGVALSKALRVFGMARLASPVVLLIVALLGGVRNYNVSIYDYSEYKPIYSFVETLPKDALLAGHPQFMDNIQTFARRKALVTYELSHPYRKTYWAEIKKRLFELFDAYYSESPEQIQDFAARYGINYIIVRDEDFPAHFRQKELSLYFEPFGQYIRERLGTRNHFALMNETNFDTVFRWRGIRVIKIASRRSNAEGPDPPQRM